MSEREVIMLAEDERLVISTYQAINGQWRGIGTCECLDNDYGWIIVAGNKPECQPTKNRARMVAIDETMENARLKIRMWRAGFMRHKPPPPMVILSIQPHVFTSES